MSYRVTEAEVREIIEVDASIALSPFISLANLLINEELDDTVLSVARLKEIERWLSAHFYCIRDPRATSEGAGPVSASYQTASLGQGLAGTTYGQQAILLDTTGVLAGISSRKKSKVEFYNLED